MSDVEDGSWLDDQAGRLVRPYAVTNGRTRPSAHFDLLTLVMATGTRPNTYLGPDYDSAYATITAAATAAMESSRHFDTLCGAADPLYRGDFARAREDVTALDWFSG